MTLEELQAQRKKVQEDSEKILRNMEKLENEAARLEQVAHNAPQILDDLDREFESITGLDTKDVNFLLVATGLQLIRIYLANEITKIEKAGKGELEDWLKRRQKKELGKIDPGDSVKDKPYYASIKHIISDAKVPYDVQTSLTEKSLNSVKNLKKPGEYSFNVNRFVNEKSVENFKGFSNHRFATVGHDPLLGLVFGTANIMTNTITFMNKTSDIVPTEILPLEIPIFTTNHVIYTTNFAHPLIGTQGSTVKMLYIMAARSIEEPEALAAALIKQFTHIGTDMYTPCGIQIPGANLVMSNSKVEELTEKFGWGDITKIGASALVATAINLFIKVFHKLTHDLRDGVSEELFEVKTRKIILYSNAIATGSNVLYTGIKTGVTGDVTQLRKLDWGGLLVLLKRLREDTKFIREIKEEFITSEFNKLIQGEDLQLEEINN